MHAWHLSYAYWPIILRFLVCARVWYITAVATQRNQFPPESSSMGSQLYVKKKLTRYIYINN